MYNNDNGKKKGFYLIKTDLFYIYINGSYCWLEIQIGPWNRYESLQFLCRDKWFNTNRWTYNI